MKKNRKYRSFSKTIYTISILGTSILLSGIIVPISYSINNAELFTLPASQSTLLPKLVIIAQSTNQKISIGLVAKFSVLAEVSNFDNENITYQWYSKLDNKPIENQTSPSIEIPTSNFIVGSSQDYYCKLNYKNSEPIFSKIFNLIITAKPIIRLQNLNDQQVTSGNNAVFNLSANVENPIAGEILKYQWYATNVANLNGQPILDQTSQSLSIDTTGFDEKSNYYYYCIVSYNNAISANSNIVKLNVTSAPFIKIVTYLDDQNIAPGTPVSFSIKAEIANSTSLLPSDFKYQWYYSSTNSTTNGQIMTGETSPTLTLEDTTSFISSSRWYYCIISHSNLPSVTSNVALLNTSNAFNKASATLALNLWLSNKDNQKKALQTYFSNTDNISAMFANEFSIENYWIKFLVDSSFVSADEILANTIPSINFDTWEIKIKVGPGGGSYIKYENGKWGTKYTSIKPNSIISFYLPFSLTQDVSLFPLNISFQNIRNISFISNNQNTTSISWTSQTTPPNAFKFTIQSPDSTNFVINTTMKNVSYPTLTSNNAGLPIYKPYELTR